MTIRTAIVIILVASSGYFFGAQPLLRGFRRRVHRTEVKKY